MSLTINTNAAAVTASYNLSRNNAALQKSLSRLSSGKRIVETSDDAGGLAVSMKLNAQISRMQGVSNNIQNAVSYLDVQDGVMQGAASIVTRMAELKALSQDVLKNSSDIENYNSEFRTLQVQLFQMSASTFNGVSLFGRFDNAGTAAVFQSTFNTVSIYTSADGEGGSAVQINKSTLLSALTIKSNTLSVAAWSDSGNSGAAGSSGTFSFAASISTTAMTLNKVSVGVFNQALQNLATLRAENGGSVSRLQFAQESAAQQRTNLEAANGRIVDVDIATESTTLAKYNILVQASASMLAQANSSANVALMLIS